MPQFALVIFGLDNIILDNTKRKISTYMELGWDQESAVEYVSKKENILTIASFNTNTVTFTASSRRNRFYEIYNRADLVKLDKAYPNAIESLKKLSSNFVTYIISVRTKDLETPTFSLMENLGFSMENLRIYFKKTHEPIQNYKRNCFNNIKRDFPTGIAIILNPSESNLVEEFDYTPIGFLSIKNKQDFDSIVTCETWVDVYSELAQQ